MSRRHPTSSLTHTRLPATSVFRLPALLYYGALFISADRRAGRLGLSGQRRAELPPIGPVLRQGGYLILVPVTLVVMMAVFGYSPLKSAVWTIAVDRKSTRLNPRPQCASRMPSSA